ncbi:MAG: hemerythrin domain-containing protein [Candidatus Thiodiazotropha sp. LLP2]
MQMLIDGFDQRFVLDLPQMDDTHLEFVHLVNQMADAEKEEFILLFQTLSEHTKSHFDSEQQLMEESNFPATSEHISDHQRILGDLARFGKRVTAGSTTMARAYICEQLPDWFELHIQTMDSALAAHLKNTHL